MEKRKLFVVAVMMVISSLACNLTMMTKANHLNVEISSPDNGTDVFQGGEVDVEVSADADKGLTKIYFSINGEVVEVQEPSKLPQSHTTNFIWIPESPGEVLLSVVVLDSTGDCTEPVSIQLNVADPVSRSGGKTP